MVTFFSLPILSHTHTLCATFEKEEKIGYDESRRCGIYDKISINCFWCSSTANAFKVSNSWNIMKKIFYGLWRTKKAKKETRLLRPFGRLSCCENKNTFHSKYICQDHIFNLTKIIFVLLSSTRKCHFGFFAIDIFFLSLSLSRSSFISNVYLRTFLSQRWIHLEMWKLLSHFSK